MPYTPRGVLANFGMSDEPGRAKRRSLAIPRRSRPLIRKMPRNQYLLRSLIIWLQLSGAARVKTATARTTVTSVGFGTVTTRCMPRAQATRIAGLSA